MLYRVGNLKCDLWKLKIHIFQLLVNAQDTDFERLLISIVVQVAKVTALETNILDRKITLQIGPGHTLNFPPCTFNGKDNVRLTTLKGGVDNGLSLMLDIQQDDYMPVWKESDEISLEAGLKAQIHDRDEPPFIHELGFGVPPGFQTLIATQEQRITFLPAPYGECLTESDTVPEMHHYFDKYSITACRITCETNYIIDQCGCRMHHM